MEVPETTFYRYTGYTAKGQPAQKHGNSSLLKP
jgi:hypothetical protein